MIYFEDANTTCESTSPDKMLTDILAMQAKRLQPKRRLIKKLDKLKKVLDYGEDEERSKRVRKNREQLKILMRAYEETDGGSWTKDDQKKLAHELGLSEQQVYKWSWD